MRLCVLAEYFYPNLMGGTGTVLSELCVGLKETAGAELDIEVITTPNMYRGEKLDLPPVETWNGVEIRRVKSPKPPRTRLALRVLAGLHFTFSALLLMLRRPRYDLVLVVTGPPVVPLAALCYRRLRGVPYLYLIHDLYPDIPVRLGSVPAEGRLARLARRCQSSWLHGARRVIVLGRCMRDYLSEAYGLPDEQLAVLTNWADDDITGLPVEASRFRQDAGLNGFVVLYSGNLGLCQDFDSLLNAAALLSKQAPEVTVCIAGEGPKRCHIEERLAREQLTNVRLLPMVPREELGDFLAAADVLLITLEPGMEGLGVPSKLYSTLAAGRPALALMAESCEVVRVLREEQCGRHVPPGSPQALVEALLELRGSPELRAQMGRQARAAYERSYTLARVAAQYRELFQRTALLRRATPAEPARQGDEASGGH